VDPSKLPSLFRRGAEALRGGVVVKKNQILEGLPPRQPRRLTPLLNKEGSFSNPRHKKIAAQIRDLKRMVTDK
jgi:hypothetical protein